MQKINNGHRYLIYPSVTHGETMYNDIRKYLLSKKLKTYREDYPSYIRDTEDTENQKRYFRNRTNLFQVNDSNELMIKVYNKKKKK